MKDDCILIKLKGEGFSPRELKEVSNLPIELVQELGDTLKLGRDKGKPSTWGFGIITIDTSNEDYQMMLFKILTTLDKVKKEKTSELIMFNDISIEVYAESNKNTALEFSTEILKTAAELNAVIIFDTHYKKEIHLSLPSPRLNTILAAHQGSLEKNTKLKIKSHFESDYGKLKVSIGSVSTLNALMDLHKNHSSLPDDIYTSYYYLSNFPDQKLSENAVKASLSIAQLLLKDLKNYKGENLETKVSEDIKIIDDLIKKQE